MKWFVVWFADHMGWLNDQPAARTQLFLLQRKPTLHRRMVSFEGAAFTHWSSGPGNYTFDSSCWWCRLKRNIKPDIAWKWRKWTFGFWGDPANHTIFGIDFGPLEIVWHSEGYRP